MIKKQPQRSDINFILRGILTVSFLKTKIYNKNRKQSQFTAHLLTSLYSCLIFHPSLFQLARLLELRPHYLRFLVPRLDQTFVLFKLKAGYVEINRNVPGTCLFFFCIFISSLTCFRWNYERRRDGNDGLRVRKRGLRWSKAGHDRRGSW